jgi:hypothetical protein
MAEHAAVAALATVEFRGSAFGTRSMLAFRSVVSVLVSLAVRSFSTNSRPASGLPHGLRPFANEARVPLVGPHLSPKPMPSRQGWSAVVLTSRAISVPFTPVMTGAERTTTDNTTATVTCADHRSPR